MGKTPSENESQLLKTGRMATGLTRQFSSAKNGTQTTVGSVRSATGFPLLLHKPLTVLTIRAGNLSMNFGLE